MPLITLSTYIKAPVNRVFDLSRSITLHTVSMIETDEKVVAGVSYGLINLNETVTWQARHFLKIRLLQTKITAMIPYTSFTDEMIKGDFKMMKHEHHFTGKTAGTEMVDNFLFQTPYNFFGIIINFLFLKKYMKKLLVKRNLVIKEYAETDKWKDVL